MSDVDEREARFQLNEAAEFVRRTKVTEEYAIQRQTLDMGPGAMVFQEGQMGDSMFIILEGEVDILKRLEDGTSRVLRTMGKGDFFGEMALIDRKKRSASAVCRTLVRLVKIPQDSLIRFIEGNPHFVMRMLNTFVDRLRGANAIIEKAMVRNPTMVVLDGVRDFLRSRSKGSEETAFDIGEFALWANYRLGIPEHTIPGILSILRAEEYLIEGVLPGSYVLASRP